jgi:hypothetical protein
MYTPIHTSNKHVRHNQQTHIRTDVPATLRPVGDDSEVAPASQARIASVRLPRMGHAHHAERPLSSQSCQPLVQSPSLPVKTKPVDSIGANDLAGHSYSLCVIFF